MKKDDMLFRNGEFFVGCNYWASHAGTNMWHDWRPEIIEEDFKRLDEADIRVVRVFPLWSDFQPLRMHRFAKGEDCEIRMREEPLPFTEAGRAGVDEVMVERFRVFLNLAEKYNLRLIVGLVTGWMSGRMHAPEMLDERDKLTDPRAVKWEIKYVRYMVKTFKDHPAIVAWDLGNECNCMGNANYEESYVWASTITNAIKVEDSKHPVVSGMHSLKPEGDWRMQDQGEILDLLTTHPYPVFTPHCNTDPMNQMKSALHATAESCYYADLGGIPCFVEEAGSIGPMVCGDEVAADYAMASMFTAWVHNCGGFVWWCANEQIELEHTPYDWCAVERELGLFYQDKSKKPIVESMTDFWRFVQKQDFTKLPPQKVDAVCILTQGQDHWAAAYGSFILAKQANMNLRFVYHDQEIPQANAYMLPSLTETRSLNRRALMEILRRVEGEGATLYLSLDDALLSPFMTYTGVRVKTREIHPAVRELELDGVKLNLPVNCTLNMESVGAEVLAYDQEGNPAFTVNEYGKGKVYFVNAPIEKIMAVEAGVVDGKNKLECWRFYEAMGLRGERLAEMNASTIGLTEHIVNENEAILVAVNYEPVRQNAIIRLKNGWDAISCESVHNDCSATVGASELEVSLEHNCGAVIRIRKQ